MHESIKKIIFGSNNNNDSIAGRMRKYDSGIIKNKNKLTVSHL